MSSYDGAAPTSERRIYNGMWSGWVPYVTISDLKTGIAILGVVNPNSIKEITVIFDAPKSNDYVVTATQYTAPNSSDTITLYTYNFTSNGFTIAAYNNGTAASGIIRACWIAK